MQQHRHEITNDNFCQGLQNDKDGEEPCMERWRGIMEHGSAPTSCLCILTSSLILGGLSLVGARWPSHSCCFCRHCPTDVMFIIVSIAPRPPASLQIDSYLRKPCFKRRRRRRRCGHGVSARRLAGQRYRTAELVVCDTNYHHH